MQAALGKVDGLGQRKLADFEGLDAVEEGAAGVGASLSDLRWDLIVAAVLAWPTRQRGPRRER
jgi:hypothetical protein